MMRKVYATLLFALLALASQAQYYDQGQSAASIKWRVMRNSMGRVIYPQSYELKAQQVSHIMDTLKPHIGYGFRHGPMRVPTLLFGQSFASNGLVMWAPKRMDLFTIPSIDTYSEPWLKQLISHEMRHTVQYNNINRHTIKALSYVIGQQGSLIGTGMMPIWYLEGDAVMAETELSSYGRGLQPDFTILYRYYASIGQKFPLDKWFCGSYRAKIPDHYQFGYQIATYAYDKYGESPLNRIAEYSAKYPFFIFTTTIALHKYYRTSVSKLANETLADLYSFWRSQPKVENTSTIVNTPTTSFTTYSAPWMVNDSTVVAVKRDSDNPYRVVLINTRTAAEKFVAHIGNPSTMPSYRDGKLYWTEYRQSTLWERRINSTLCTMNLATGTKGTVRGERRVLYPTQMGERSLAMVEYDYGGSYSIKHPWGRLQMPDSISLHGLAYDSATDNIYFIGLSDGGMWIGSTPSSLDSFSHVTPAKHITINNLRAHDGKLYFNSIVSGKDEAHLYDLAQGKEYRITNSTFGSFSPTPTLDGNGVVMTTFAGTGYMVAHQKLDDIVEVEPRDLPMNTVNPPRKGWGSKINIDTMNFDSATIPNLKSKRYRRGLNMFNFHSWTPLYMDPEHIMDDIRFSSIKVGATLMSQNLLGSMSAIFGYSYTDQGSMWRGKINYYGLPVKIETEVLYGGGNRDIDVISGGGFPLPPQRSYFGVAARLFVPLTFASGYHNKVLTPVIEFAHSNSVLVNVDNNVVVGYRVGQQTMKGEIQYSDNVNMATKDFLPRYGYALRAGLYFSPTNNDISTMRSLYARGFLPGVASHHSLKIEIADERQGVRNYSFSPQVLRLEGVDNNYIKATKYQAGRLSYQLPLWYPDGGIPSFVYFKRVRLNVVGGYARYIDSWSNGSPRNLYSYGGELVFDISVLSLPSSVKSSVGVSIFKPSNRKGVVFGVNISIPL